MIDGADSWALNITVIGKFAPQAFHPTWFENKSLLGKTEVQAVDVEKNFLISKDLSLFTIGAFDFQIRTDRISISISREDQVMPLKDLICSTLRILEPASITYFGINSTAHFKMPSEKTWHAAGDKLVPKDFWKSIWPNGHVGMSSLDLTLARDDEYKGSVVIKIQPSTSINYGVFILINDHFDFTSVKEFDGVATSEKLEKCWDTALKRSKNLMDGISKEIQNVPPL